MRGIYITQAARKRKIGRAHLEFAMTRCLTGQVAHNPRHANQLPEVK
jgi:hypothetical protein